MNDGGARAGQEPLLVFDRALRLAGWTPATETLPALTGLLTVGIPLAAVDEGLKGYPVRDTRLADGGLVRLLGSPARPAPDSGSRLFAAASHDLRQPLAAMSLLLGALEARVTETAAHEVLRSMTIAVQSMKSMVDGHFDLVRLRSGMVEPEIAPHAVNGILTRLALDFAPRFEARRLPFSVEPCSAIIETDAALLERAVHALLSSALRHTECGRVLLGCRRRGDTLRIEVWDGGHGLPADQLALLRAGADRPPGDERTASVLGFGLALASGLTQRLGHRFQVDAVPGRCTRYSFVVGLANDQDEDANPAALLSAPTDTDVSRARVLVIEDDRLVLDALGVLLGEWGCAVVGADSAEAALTALDTMPQPPELIIADLRLKGAANGIVAIRQITKALDSAVPGLILTGDTDPKRLREARLSGYPLLHKPVAPLALRAALAGLLGRELLPP